MWHEHFKMICLHHHYKSFGITKRVPLRSYKIKLEPPNSRHGILLAFNMDYLC